MLPQQVADGIVQGAVYALFAVGYALIFGLLDVLNLAHAAVLLWGALLAWWLLALLHLPLAAVFVLVVLACGSLGLALNRLAFAPLRRQASNSLRPLIAGLALAAILEGLARGAFGSARHAYPPTALVAGSSQLGTVRIDWVQLIVPAVALALLLVLRRLITSTRYGRAIRAIAENPRAAALLGVNVDTTIAWTFFLASALGGAAGVLYGLSTGGAVFSGGEPLQLRGLAIIVLGGMGSISGAVLGGFALGLLEAFSATLLAAQYRDVVPFAVLLLVLLLRPSGIGKRRAARGAW